MGIFRRRTQPTQRRRWIDALTSGVAAPAEHPLTGTVAPAGAGTSVATVAHPLAGTSAPAATGTAVATTAANVPVPLTPTTGSAASPVTLVWTMVPVAGAVNAHTQVQADESGGAYATPEVSADSMTAAIQYDSSAGKDGTGPWLAFPAAGLPAADQDRRARYETTLTAGAKIWRARMLAAA